MGGTSAKVDIQVDNELPVLEIDRNQIQQVIHHLIYNARQATQDRSTIFSKREQLSWRARKTD
ncbi:MAG: hypothetical protein AAGA18_07845 [Verrucomicrobiota bacterium]